MKDWIPLTIYFFHLKQMPGRCKKIFRSCWQLFGDVGRGVQSGRFHFMEGEELGLDFLAGLDLPGVDMNDPRFAGMFPDQLVSSPSEADPTNTSTNTDISRCAGSTEALINALSPKKPDPEEPAPAIPEPAAPEMPEPAQNDEPAAPAAPQAVATPQFDFSELLGTCACRPDQEEEHSIYLNVGFQVQISLPRLAMTTPPPPCKGPGSLHCISRLIGARLAAPSRYACHLC